MFVGCFFTGWYCLGVHISCLFVGGVGGGTEGAGVVIQGGDALMGAGDLKSKEIKAATVQVGVDQDIDGAAVDGVSNRKSSRSK